MESLPSIVNGINAVEVPVCFRNVSGKILQPCRVVATQVEPCSCVPDCYDMEVPGGLG